MDSKMVFEVTVWMKHNHYCVATGTTEIRDCCYVYNLVAKDDLEARDTAVSNVKVKYLKKDFIGITYCETKLLAELDN